MRVTSKDQVTVPIKISEQADGKVVRTAKSRQSKDRGAKLIARMRKSGDVNMSTDEILALTRGD